MRFSGHAVPDDSSAAHASRFAPRASHRGVREADHGVRGKTVRDVHLDGDGLTLDTDEGGATDRGEHDGPPCIIPEHLSNIREGEQEGRTAATSTV